MLARADLMQLTMVIPGLQTGLQSLLHPRNWGDLMDLTGVMVVSDEISVPIEKKRRG